MKYVIIILAITLADLSKVHSQSLAGVWEGWFLNPGNTSDTVAIKLDFRSKQDGLYDVYDFTKSGDFKTVCKMTYRLLSKNSIYLEEVEVIKTNKPDRMIFLQNMKLKIEGDFKTMTGKWSCNIKKLKCNGTIYFVKKEE